MASESREQEVRFTRGEKGATGATGPRGRTGPQTKDVRVIRPRPWLFLIIMAVMIYGLYRVSTNDCQLTHHLGGVYAQQAARARALAVTDTSPKARRVHLAAAKTSEQVAHQLTTGRFGCPSFLP